MRISFVAAELVYRRLLPGPMFSEPQRRLLELHLDNSFRQRRMVAKYPSVQAIFSGARILQNHYYRALNPLLKDGVLQEISNVAYALNPEPALWAFERQPAVLEKTAVTWNKSATNATPDECQGEFFEWPEIMEGTRLSFLEAAMQEIYLSTGAGGEIPRAELPSSRGRDDDPGPKGCQRREIGTTRAEQPPAPGPEARSPSRPGAGQSATTTAVVLEADTTVKVVSGGPEQVRRGAGYHREGGIHPPQAGDDTTLAVVSEGNTTVKVVSPDPHKQGLRTLAELAITEEANKIKGETDTTLKVVSSDPHKQRSECANTTLAVVSGLARARNVNVTNVNGTNVKRSKCRCSLETEERLLAEIAAFFAAPGSKAMTADQVRIEMVGHTGRDGSGKFWRCWVVRPFPDQLEIALHEGLDWLRQRKSFNKSRPQWLNWQVRMEAGLSSWSECQPILKREPE